MTSHRYEVHARRPNGDIKVVEMWADNKADCILRVLRDVPWVQADTICILIAMQKPLKEELSSGQYAFNIFAD